MGQDLNGRQRKALLALARRGALSKNEADEFNRMIEEGEIVGNSEKEEKELLTIMESPNDYLSRNVQRIEAGEEGINELAIAEFEGRAVEGSPGAGQDKFTSFGDRGNISSNPQERQLEEEEGVNELARAEVSGKSVPGDGSKPNDNPFATSSDEELFKILRGN